MRSDGTVSSAVHRWLRDDMGRGQLSLDNPSDLMRDMAVFLKRKGFEGALARLDAEREQAQREGILRVPCDYSKSGRIWLPSNGPLANKRLRRTAFMRQTFLF